MFATVVRAGEAGLASVARDVGLDRDLVANLEGLHRFVHGKDLNKRISDQHLISMKR